MPVGLWDYCHTEAFRFDKPADDSGSKGRMVNIGIGRENNDIGHIPAAQVHFLTRGWQPVGQTGRIHKGGKQGIERKAERQYVGMPAAPLLLNRPQCRFRLVKVDKIFQTIGFHLVMIDHIYAKI